MEETNRTFRDDEGEETMISPRFDDEETVLARPVVPLEEVGDAPGAPPPTAARPPLYSRLRDTPRRSLVAVLVLVSALAGSVLGVGGLYLYQKHRSATASAPAAEQQQQAETPAAAQPTAATESKGRETSAPAAESSAPAAAEPDAKDVDDDADSARDAGAEEADASHAVERREVSEARNPVSATKRGKKAERDEEVPREERRARRDDDDDRPLRADDSDDDRREARRVGVITYRPRRVRPRRDTYNPPDRLRRIFEGQP